MERPTLEVADVFRRYGGTYRDEHGAYDEEAPPVHIHFLIGKLL